MRWTRKNGGRKVLYFFSAGLAVITLLSLTTQFSIRNLNKTLKERIDLVQKDRRDVPPLPGLFDFKGVIHAHTRISHDSPGTPEEVVRSAHEAGLRFLMTTDHNNPRIFTEGVHGRFGDLLVIRGAEIGKEGQYLLALNIKEYIESGNKSIQQVIEAIHAQEGLAFVAHPSRFKDWGVTGIDGMEIYDIADNAYEKAWKAPWMALEVLTSWDDYPEEVFLGLLSRPRRSLSKWDELIQTGKLVGIAGNDTHQNLDILGRQLDPYSLDFRYVQTHLLAPAFEERALLSALKQGHAYLSFGLLADATGFQFLAGREKVEGIMGDEVPRSPGLFLTVQSPQTALIQLYHNGRVIDEVVADRLSHPVEEKGVYRVEVFLQIGRSRYPWIFSNPIYVS
jgi:hypothetical protein